MNNDLDNNSRKAPIDDTILRIPESLDEAVREAKAQGIIEQIDCWDDAPPNDGVTIILDRCPHIPQRFDHAQCSFDQKGRLTCVEHKRGDIHV